ncbi:hypothetical protein PACTADRAFT_43138 [Pachysolen tannophilus NRRL Y-2460]|uniref:ribonuclease Z n=1 Tax=Pachysolen tannophilus NRRL Y-2460 TaxID=669874 RepID=A0A1E4TV08_PACTA|nr:hypothetical protein PACTADRAFT_43138 [Pachysolen tannophilus NRRL Y-2460]
MYVIQPLAHPTYDTKKPVLVLTSVRDGKKFLIGSVSEGTQRLFNEAKIKAGKVENIFLTGNLNWDSISGLPGLILTISDQGKKNLNIVSGLRDGVIHYVMATWRYFIFRFGIDICTKSLKDGEIYKEKDFIIKALNVGVEENSQQVEVDDAISGDFMNNLKKIVDKIFPLDINLNDYFISKKHYDKLLHLKLPYFSKKKNQQVHSTSTNYLIKFNQCRGKFLPKKAIELGVPTGRLFAQLTSGIPVELPSGIVVKPEQVMEPPRNFPKVLILDIPNLDILNQTINCDKLFRPVDENDEDKIGIVYHFIGDSVPDNFLDLHGYLKFITEKFDQDCKHYISHKSCSPNSLSFEKSALVTLKLKSINNEMFRLPTGSLRAAEFSQDNLAPLIANQKVSIKSDGIFNPDELKNSKRTIQDYWEELFESKIKPLELNIYSKKEILNTKIENDKNLQESLEVSTATDLREEVEIITLGTGSAIPSKYRNVVSTIVRVPYIDDKTGKIQFNSVVLDAGENTIGSIKRIYGSQLPIFFKELKLIYLSHLHADHHLGIISLIQEFNKFQEKNNNKENYIYIICPWQYDLFLKEWDRIDDLENLKYCKYISCEDFLVPNFNDERRKPLKQNATLDFEEEDTVEYEPSYEGDYKAEDELMLELYRDLKIRKIETCRAIHCDWAYSVSLIFEIDNDKLPNNNDNFITNFKISYSGDTRPNISFAKKTGYGSDLLIHEATLDDQLIDDAISKCHSTISEAIFVGRLMDCKKTILTHFSQRYPKLPDLNYKFNIFEKLNNVSFDGDGAQAQNLLYAFDNMIIKYNSIHKQMENFSKVGNEKLYKIFGDEAVEEEQEDAEAKDENNINGTGKNDTNSNKRKNNTKSDQKNKIEAGRNVSEALFQNVNNNIKQRKIAD